MKEALVPTSGESAVFAWNMPPEFLVAGLVIPILLGIYFVSKA